MVCLCRFFTVEATEKECALLAKRFSVESIAGLTANLRVQRGTGNESRKIKVKVITIKGRGKTVIIFLCENADGIRRARGGVRAEACARRRARGGGVR